MTAVLRGRKKKEKKKHSRRSNLAEIRFQFRLRTRVSCCFTTTQCAAKIACTPAPMPASRRACRSFAPIFRLMFWQNSVISYQLTQRPTDAELTLETSRITYNTTTINNKQINKITNSTQLVQTHPRVQMARKCDIRTKCLSKDPHSR